MARANDQLRCGECGHDKFTLIHKNDGDVRWGGHGADGIEGVLIVQCAACADTTTITVTPARLHSDGNLCGGWAGESLDE